MLEKLHIYIAIIAALIVNICCIVLSSPLYTSVLYIIITIIVFYCIGILFRNFIIRNFYPPEEQKNVSDENVDSDGQVLETEGAEVSLESDKKAV